MQEKDGRNLYGFTDKEYQSLSFEKPWIGVFWSQSQLGHYVKTFCKEYPRKETGGTPEQRAIVLEARKSTVELLAQHYSMSEFVGISSGRRSRSLQKVFEDKGFFTMEAEQKSKEDLERATIAVCNEPSYRNFIKDHIWQEIFQYFEVALEQRMYNVIYTPQYPYPGVGQPGPSMADMLRADAGLYRALSEKHDIEGVLNSSALEKADSGAVKPRHL